VSDPKRAMCALVLALEAITLALTTPVMINLGGIATGPALAAGLGPAVLSLLTAGLLRARWGYWIGHLVQVIAVAMGFVVPTMFVLGVVFAVLWGAAYGVGRKIERERAAAYAAYEAEQETQ
jgi:hypothetical protein